MAEDLAPVVWLGVGAMGLPMLGHLVRAGHAVTAYDPRRERLQLAAQASHGLSVLFRPSHCAAPSGECKSAGRAVGRSRSRLRIAIAGTDWWATMAGGVPG